MKKLSIILLAILLTVSLFVSCDNTTKAVTDERVAVTFSTGADSRSLSYVIENVSELNWYYTAQKNSADTSPFSFGATTTETPITLGSRVEFSQGLWDFTLLAKRVDNGEEGAIVYKGSSTGVLITKENSPNNIVIDVFPKVEGSTGSIELNKVKITKRGTSETVYANKAVINGAEISIDGPNYIGRKTELTPGDYDVTVMYKDTVDGEGQSQELTYASETITVTVWSGRTTTVSGNLSELTGSAIINGNIRVPSIATINKIVSASEPTVFYANVAPSNNAQSTTLDKTTVTFPVGTLTEESASLVVNVTPIDADFTVGVVGSSTPVGAISLTLDNQENSNFGEKEVTVETYIAKNLSNVKVYYGNEAITGSTYESDTGKLTFKTNHFSDFYLVADSFDVINLTTNSTYNNTSTKTGLETALESATAGDYIMLYSDVTLNSALNIDKSITLVGRSIGEKKPKICSNADKDAVLIQSSGSVIIKGIRIENTNASGKDKRTIGIGKNLNCIQDLTLTLDEVELFAGMRGIQVYADNCKNVKLNVNNSVIQKSDVTDYEHQVVNHYSSPHARGISIWNFNDESELNITNSTIEGFWGAIFVGGGSNDGLQINCTDSAFRGRCDINIVESKNVTANFIRCLLHGINNLSGKSESFANIVIGNSNDNINVNVTDSTFSTYQDNIGTVNEYAIQYAVRNDSTDSVVVLKGNTRFVNAPKSKGGLIEIISVSWDKLVGRLKVEGGEYMSMYYTEYPVDNEPVHKAMTKEQFAKFVDLTTYKIEEIESNSFRVVSNQDV